jgi:hypothetical protein
MFVWGAHPWSDPRRVGVQAAALALRLGNFLVKMVFPFTGIIREVLREVYQATVLIEGLNFT